MKCKCGAASSVLETRALAPGKTKRFRECTKCMARFETVEVMLAVAVSASVVDASPLVASKTPEAIRRRREAALAVPYLPPDVLALQLGCKPKTIRAIRERAGAR